MAIHTVILNIFGLSVHFFIFISFFRNLNLFFFFTYIFCLYPT